MKKISSILVSGTIATLLAISFSGCGASTPEPFSMKVQNYSNVTNQEKNTLIAHNMQTIKQFYPDRTGRYSSPSRVRGNVISYHGLNATFSHRFIVNSKTGYMERIDVSSASHGRDRGEDAYDSLTNDFGFTDYINKYQVTLGKKYATSLEKFSKYKKEYNHHKQEAEYKKEHLQVHFIDTTNILPKKVLAQLSNDEHFLSVQNTPMRLFLRGQDVSKAFILKSYIKADTFGRYKVVYKQPRFEDVYTAFPSTINYEITEVYFNYIPEKFTAHDSNIDVEVLNTPFGDETIKYIKIQNNTKEFIELDTIAGYYGEDVTDNIINIEDLKRVKIAPMSYKILKTGFSYKYRVNDFPENKLLPVHSRNQKVPYGFSVGYKMINQNIIKNLYKVDTYTIQDFQ
jgi:hypothetical protein